MFAMPVGKTSQAFSKRYLKQSRYSFICQLFDVHRWVHFKNMLILSDFQSCATVSVGLCA